MPWLRSPGGERGPAAGSSGGGTRGRISFPNVTVCLSLECGGTAVPTVSESLLNRVSAGAPRQNG